MQKLNISLSLGKPSFKIINFLKKKTSSKLQDALAEKPKSSHAIKLTRWKDEKMKRWQDERMTIWQDDKMTGWQDDRMARCQGDKMTKWQDDKITRWQDEKMIKWQDDKITRWHKEKMTRSHVNGLICLKIETQLLHFKSILNVKLWLTDSLTHKGKV